MNDSRSRWWLAAALIAALALAASANSIVNGFTYDDIYAIVRDPRAHTMQAWWTEFTSTYWAPRWSGDGYRPMTRILFRVAWAVGGGSPVPFHALNVLLHLAGAVSVFWLACAVLPFGAAWIAAALYAVHPVHTEAVANAVGLAELGVLLPTVIAAGLYVHARRSGPVSWRRWVAIGALYAVACLFKEHGIMFPALLAAAELTVVSDRAPLRQRLIGLRLPILVLALVGVSYLWLRSSVVTGLSGFAATIAFQTLKLGTTHRILTMIGAAPEWYRLLLWPARLITDYTPPYIDIAEGPNVVQLPGALLLLGTFGLAVACRRRSPVTTFGILWIAITLLPASNFIIPAGILLAERTLMLPSVGAMIALASAIPWLYERVEQLRASRIAGAAALTVLIGLGVARSYTRNRAWHDNERLFRQGVADAPTSYRLHYLLGNHLVETNRREEGIQHLEMALRLFPYDPLLPYAVADELRLRGNCEPAIELYRWAFQLARVIRHRQLGLATCLMHTLRLDEAKAATLDALRHGARYSDAVRVLRAIEEGKDSLEARRARGDSAVLAGGTRAPE